jgi:hypothetical protein
MLTTTYYDIPYPEATDAPCTLATLLTDAAGRIGMALATLQAGVNDLVDRPATRVSLENQTFETDGYNDFVGPFGSVDFDYRGTVDLDTDNASFQPSEDAVWLTGCHMYMDGVVNGSHNECDCNPYNTFSARDSAGVVGADTSLLSSGSIENCLITDYVNMHVWPSSGTSPITMVRAYMWLVRLTYQ